MTHYSVVPLSMLWLMSLGGMYGQARDPQQRGEELLREAKVTTDIHRKIELLEEAARLIPSAAVHIELGAAYESAGTARLNDAKDQYRRAYEIVLAERKNHAAAMLLGQMAVLEERAGRLLDALKTTEAAQRLDPGEARLAGKLTALRLRLTRETISVEDIHRGFATARQFDVGPPSVDLYVHFESDKATLAPAGVEQANELGRALSSESYGNARFEVIGHTDRHGSAEYNLSLSARRAETVKNHLVRKYAIAAERLTTTGMGKSQLLQHGETAEDDAINRRVQVRMIGQ